MKQENRPLVRALQTFKSQEPISFHVPGHKHGLLSDLPDELGKALTYDVTELSGLDDLHEPEGVIQEAEELLSTLYQSNQSFFLVNGSTVGNLAMIYATCQANDTIIVQRNAHKSIFNAIELTGARPVLLSPPWDEYTRTPGILTLSQVKEALVAYPDAKGIVLTYPTYYGVVGEGLRKIIELCHERSIPVLVDEAHGAHFIAGRSFPDSALEAGADVVVHSAHKTLPAMTMASYLHVKSNIVSVDRIAHYLTMLQSSSPSYLLMASLDDARAYVQSYTLEDERHFMNTRKFFIDKLRELQNIEVVETDDPLKLLIRKKGYSGFSILSEFEKQGIFAELADPFQVLLVLPLLKEKTNYMYEESVERIKRAVRRLNEKDMEEEAEVILLDEGISTLSYPIQELNGMKKEWRPMDQAEGCIAASSIIPYPPGIPLLIGGERVTEKHIKRLEQYLRLQAKFQGAIRIEERQIEVAVIDGGISC